MLMCDTLLRLRAATKTRSCRLLREKLNGDCMNDSSDYSPKCPTNDDRTSTTHWIRTFCQFRKTASFGVRCLDGVSNVEVLDPYITCCPPKVVLKAITPILYFQP